jgi:hypothetical protein
MAQAAIVDVIRRLQSGQLPEWRLISFEHAAQTHLWAQGRNTSLGAVLKHTTQSVTSKIFISDRSIGAPAPTAVDREEDAEVSVARWCGGFTTTLSPSPTMRMPAALTL